MKLVFKHIKIENFLSLGECELKLDNRGFTLVRGVNNNKDDMAKSNGSGKSSIFEAIAWCLTGETIRGIKDVVNMFNPGGCLVELDFDVDGQNYKLIRSKDHKTLKTDLKIFVNNEDRSGKGIRDSQKLLQEYLPDLTPSLVGSVILLGQGLPQRFTNNTPSGRKEVLERLSKSDFMIEDLKQRISARKATLSTQVREVEDKILTAETSKKTLESQNASYNAQLAALESIDVYEDLINKSTLYINQLTNDLQVCNENKSALNSESSTLSDKMHQINLQIEQELNIALRDITTKKNEMNIELSVSRTKISGLEAEVSRAKSIKDVCPTCGQKIVNVVIPDTSDQETEISILKTKVGQLQADIDSLRTEESSISSTFGQKKQGAIRPIQDRLNIVSEELRKLNTQSRDLETRISSERVVLQGYENKKANYVATVETLNRNISTNLETIKQLEADLVYYIDDKETLKLRQDAINKFNTIVTRDFRGYLLKNVIEYIDKRAKEYSKLVFETDKLDFSLDGNNIDVCYCGKQVESLSGGERQKLDIIIQFTLRDMLCQFLGYSCNIIACDEIFDALDSVGCDKIVDLITTKLTDVDSIFIITHHTDISIPSDDVITVNKQENGVSYLE